MSSGLVVVSSGVGGAGELIDDGRTGLRFKPGDSEDLARCLMRLINNPILLNKLRTMGQKDARENFSVRASAKALEAGFKVNGLSQDEAAIF